MTAFDEEDIFREVYAEFTDGTGPSQIQRIEREYRLSLIGRGTTRLVFRTHSDVMEKTAIVKIGIPERAGPRMNERESGLWQAADSPQRELLAPVLATDPENRWLAMPLIDVGVTPEQAYDFHRQLTATGLAIRDVTPGDIGIYDGGPVLIDYGGCKPIEKTPVNSEEMFEIVEKRWEDWNGSF